MELGLYSFAETAPDAAAGRAETPADRLRDLLEEIVLADQLGLDEMLAQILDATWRRSANADYAGEIQRTVDAVALARLFALAASPDATPQVKAVVMAELAALRDWLATNSTQVAAPAQQAHYAYGARLIAQFFEHPKDFAPPRVPAPPPGQPIGETLGCGF